MLVLTRKIGESVIIAEGIYCTVAGYRDSEVRLAFDAPKTLPIHREEIQKRIWQERQQNQWLDNFNHESEQVLERLLVQWKQKIIDCPKSLSA